MRPGAVAAWPAWELDLVDSYLRRTPPVSERIELLIARLTTGFLNVHRGKDAREVHLADLLPHQGQWLSPEPKPGETGEYTELDLEIMRELMK